MLARALLRRSTVLRPAVLVVARALRASAPRLCAAFPSMVTKLEEMRAAPWWKSGPMSAMGMFSDQQWQRAAGEDIYRICVVRAAVEDFYDPALGAVDRGRFFCRFQLKGLHFWLVHLRL